MSEHVRIAESQGWRNPTKRGMQVQHVRVDLMAPAGPRCAYCAHALRYASMPQLPHSYRGVVGRVH